MNLVIQWFGDKFERLDPLLQELHRYGGELSGVVVIEYGSSIAGLVGHRLAQKFGLPCLSGEHEFHVSISHTDSALNWSRCFDSQYKMASVFTPHDHYPTGYWRETSGRLSLTLGVVVKDGGWYWVQRKITFMGVPLPLFLFPSSEAYKRINNGKYEFSVSFSLPFIGKLFSYSGLLTPKLKVA
ncbi:DUF4166 domain-containing protein [Atopomonas sediminilitoris]|uniref:DUF4166 domain-containing protein n=1 Tax=Atopomonas sediminilitoris TaxID=2919919 RepID=UPI001F4E90DF|nr:DUF4166 domain-containing protein [Atopomonas sediminilitoris]MCJ8170749.1 DUF4166 domain-containing protein [Atopomonas sediminilitoris]